MLACLDLEGVLLPEIWIAFANKTGIEKLRLTTRDIADYDFDNTHYKNYDGSWKNTLITDEEYNIISVEDA